MNKNKILQLALDALEGFIPYLPLKDETQCNRYDKAITAIKKALETKDEPKCVAIVEVFEKDWRIDYMSLPVGKHNLYAQQYTYTTTPQSETKDEPKLIGWRTADFLNETTDIKSARNWEVHYEVLPIFEGDPNTKLVITPQPKQEQDEPVAMRYDFDGYGYKYIDNGSGSDWRTRIKDAEPLYTTPQRTWVGLTDEEVYAIGFDLNIGGIQTMKAYQAIEAKLKELNT